MRDHGQNHCLVIKAILPQTMINLKKNGIVLRVMVRMVEDIYKSRSGENELNKFGVTNTGHKSFNTFQCFDLFWMAYSDVGKAWRGYSHHHTTDFHDVTLAIIQLSPP